MRARMRAAVAAAAVLLAACGAGLTEPAPTPGARAVVRDAECLPFHQWTTPDLTPAACKAAMAGAGLDTTAARWGR